MGLLEVGQLVTSRMGRDSGRKYVVIAFYNESQVLVADGSVRTIDRPKRKNLKHLIIHRSSLNKGHLEDQTISKFIEEHSNEENIGEEGLLGYGER